MYIVSIYIRVQNYRPTYEQTNILLDQSSAKNVFSHIIWTGGGGGGVLLLKLFA